VTVERDRTIHSLLLTGYGPFEEYTNLARFVERIPIPDLFRHLIKRNCKLTAFTFKLGE
jgi:hypothetical protein